MADAVPKVGLKKCVNEHIYVEPAYVGRKALKRNDTSSRYGVAEGPCAYRIESSSASHAYTISQDALSTAGNLQQVLFCAVCC